MSLFSTAIRLVQNKIVRYPGGQEIDRFRGISPAKDDGRPEAWVGSTATTEGAGKGGKDINDGRAYCILPDGSEMLFKDAILLDVEAALGAKHIQEYGKEPALLVKLLDAQEQLAFQCHPSPEYALEHWGSKYGKAECWYILSLREDTSEPPYVLLGFKEGISREKFADLFDRGDIRAIDSLLHKIPVKPGELYWVGPGVPHAIGAGVFCIEAQEPSDITVGASPLANATEAAAAKHRERLLGAYDYKGCSYEENLRLRHIQPLQLSESADGLSRELLLIGNQQTSCFAMTRIEAAAAFTPSPTGRCAIHIITEGRGKIRCADSSLEVKRGDELFIAAAASNFTYIPEGGSLTVVVSHPPGTSW